MSASDSTPALTPEYLAQDRGYVVRDTVIAFTVLIVVATGLRTWSRLIQKNRFVPGDIFIAFSLLFILATYTALLLGVRYGAGRHVVTLSPAEILSFSKTIWLAIPICYIIAVIWPKLAILDLYLHIFINKYERWASYGCGLVLILNAVICVSLTLGQCRPFEKTWNRAHPGTCIDTSTLFVWAGFANIITDFAMLAIPVRAILKLQRNWQTKAGILLTFAVASVDMAISIVRFYQFYENSIQTSSPDPTYNVITVFVWTVVEPGVYHLVACFLTYQSLFRWLSHKRYLSNGWSRLSTWLVSKPGSKSSDMESATTERPSIANSTTSQYKRSDSHWDQNEMELETSEVYAPKRGYSAKIETQSDAVRQHEARMSQHEGGQNITIKKDFEVRSETVSNSSNKSLS